MNRTRWVLASVAALVITSVLSPVASAHDDSHKDGIDPKTPFDIAKVATSHNGDRVRFQVSMHDRFSLSDIDLRQDRYFFIGFDLDMQQGDRKLFERCVFVIDRPRVVAFGTNCGHRRLDSSTVQHPTSKSFATAIDLKRLDVDGSYRFAVISYWGAASCPKNLCIDAAPDRLPLYLEDREDPTIGFHLDDQTEPTFPMTFKVKDPEGGSGIKKWILEKAPEGTEDWQMVATGSGDGTKSPTVTPGGGRWTFRVRAIDKQGNEGVSDERDLELPYDDLELPSFGAFGGTVGPTDDVAAFGGSYTAMSNGASFDMSFTSTGCSDIVLRGPGTDGWTATFQLDAEPINVWSGTEIFDGARQQLVRYGNVCDGAHTIAVDVTAGTGFGLDLVSVGGGTIAPTP